MIRKRVQPLSRVLFTAFVGVAASLAFAPKATAYVNDSTAPPGCTNGCGNPCPPAAQPPVPQPMQSCGPWMPAGSCGGGGGMPQWWIQEPTVNLRLEDEPLGYDPALGPRVAFDLSYRQRGAVSEDPAIFGVGPNWSCSFRTYLMQSAGDLPNVFHLHKLGAGWIDYDTTKVQPLDGSILTSTANGYEIEYKDGTKESFAQPFTNNAGTFFSFITSKADPTGNTMTFNYLPYPTPPCCYANTTVSNAGPTAPHLHIFDCYFTNCTLIRLSLVNCCVTNCTLIDTIITDPSTDCACPPSTPAVVQLTGVVDGDGRITTIGYGDPVYTNQITSVTDPFGRVSTIKYDSSGYLSNITDVISMTTFFAYDIGASRSFITNMTSPYGNTGFRNIESYGYLRAAEVTPPTGGKHLSLYLEVCTNLPTQYSPFPDTSPFANTLDNVDQRFRNSFEWGPMQYAGLSSSYILSGNVSNLTTGDFNLARLRHWLAIGDPGGPATNTSHVLSVERAPTPDTIAQGQVTWYDYPDKWPGHNEFVGSNYSILPTLTALVLPDGSTRYTRDVRAGHLQVTNRVSTYSKIDGTVGQRTNNFIYAANWVDLKLHIGPQAEQVVSNYFSNTHHQPDLSYDALNQETRFTYDANWQVTKIFNPAGLTTTNIYLTADPGSNMLGTTIDLEILRTNIYTYTNGLVYTHTDERGLRTTNLWDNLQRLTRVSYPDNTYVSNLYTALDLTGNKDRMNYWTYFGYNPIRQKVAETNGNGVVTRYGYCDCGALLYLTNAWGTPIQQVTQYGYDYQANRTYIYNADGYNVTNWYNSIGQIYQTGDGPGYTYFDFNNQGLATNSSSAYGGLSATIYDVEDLPLWVTDVNGVTVTNTYDLLGRLRTKTYPDQGVEAFGYSARGMIAHTNQIGATNFFAYDEGARKIFETNANYELLRYTNNAAGDLLSLTDGKNQTTRWNYDEYGRCTNKLDQGGTEILRYIYDPDNRLTNRWSVAKGNTKYTFDPVGNLTLIDYPSSTVVTMQYDWLNRVTNMVDGVGTTKYTYTAGNQLLSEDGPFGSDVITNAYSNRLRTNLGLQQPTGMWTNLFVFDAAKRLTNVTSPAGSFGYTLGNGGVSAGSPLINRVFLPNNSTIRHSYDSVARLLTIKLLHGVFTTVDSYTYAYDPANERTNVTRVDGSSVAYKYDLIGQLTVADSSVNTEDRGYTYDSAWNLNRRTNNGAVTTFGVNGLNELTTGPDGSYSSDANGNLLGKGIWTYSYDDENRLAWFQGKPNGAPYVLGFAFSYDGLGRKRQWTEYYYNPSIEDWVFYDQKSYNYDGWRVIQERDVNNTPTVSYTRGTDLGGSLEGAGGIGGLLARSDGYSGGNWTSHNYYFADGNGNVTYVESSGQSMVANYRYDPFGNTISSGGTLSGANVYRFSSKEIDVSSGVYYYGYRFYDPNLQRWLNRDPIEERGGLNLYSFALNEPVSRADAWGRRSSMQPSCGCAERSSIVRAWGLANLVITSPQYASCLAAKLGQNNANTVLNCQKALLGPKEVKVKCSKDCPTTPYTAAAKGEGSTITICYPTYFNETADERAKIIAHEFIHLDECGALRHRFGPSGFVNGFVFDSVEACFTEALKAVWGGPPYPK